MFNIQKVDPDSDSRRPFLDSNPLVIDTVIVGGNGHSLSRYPHDTALQIAGFMEAAYDDGYVRGRGDAQQVAIMTAQGVLVSLEQGKMLELIAGLRKFLDEFGVEPMTPEEFLAASSGLNDGPKSNQDTPEAPRE